jgi:hypothetical protein
VRRAAMEADSNQIIILADQIRKQKPVLALALTVMANNFDHDAILDAIKGGAK